MAFTAEAKSTKKILPDVVREKTYEFELVGDYRPINFGIGSECVVYNPVDKKEMAIRYVPGWESIVVADQPDIEERLIPKVDLNLSRGKMNVHGSKTQLVQFLLMHDHIEGNENSVTKVAQFRLVDKTAELKNTRDKLNSKRLAMTKAVETDFVDVIPFAKVLGVEVAQKAGEDQQTYEDRVRTSFMQKAEDDSESFLKGFEDPKHKREYDIILAFEQGIITDSFRDGEVNWSKSKELIVKMPSDAVTRKFLAEYTFKEKGGEFYAMLKKLIKY